MRVHVHGYMCMGVHVCRRVRPGVSMECVHVCVLHEASVRGLSHAVLITDISCALHERSLINLTLMVAPYASLWMYHNLFY